MSNIPSTKIPVFAIGYFGIVLSNSVETTLFDFYPVPLNSRQKGLVKKELIPKIIDFEKLDDIIQLTATDTKVTPVPLFIVVDTVFNSFDQLFSILNKFKNRLKSIFCVQTSEHNIKKEIKRILKSKPQNLDIMIVVFEGDEKEGVCKAKEFFESTDFILSNTGFINMSLLDFLTLGDIIFFSKYTDVKIDKVQKQVMDYFTKQKKFFDFKNVKKIIINFKAPTSLTVAEVNDALHTIIDNLSKDVEVQWGLFAADSDSIEVIVYFGLSKDTFLK